MNKKLFAAVGSIPSYLISVKSATVSEPPGMKFGLKAPKFASASHLVFVKSAAPVGLVNPFTVTEVCPVNSPIVWSILTG